MRSTFSPNCPNASNNQFVVQICKLPIWPFAQEFCIRTRDGEKIVLFIELVLALVLWFGWFYAYDSNIAAHCSTLSKDLNAEFCTLRCMYMYTFNWQMTFLPKVCSLPLYVCLCSRSLPQHVLLVCIVFCHRNSLTLVSTVLLPLILFALHFFRTEIYEID